MSANDAMASNSNWKTNIVVNLTNKDHNKNLNFGVNKGGNVNFCRFLDRFDFHPLNDSKSTLEGIKN